MKSSILAWSIYALAAWGLVMLVVFGDARGEDYGLGILIYGGAVYVLAVLPCSWIAGMLALSDAVGTKHHVWNIELSVVLLAASVGPIYLVVGIYHNAFPRVIPSLGLPLPPPTPFAIAVYIVTLFTPLLLPILALTYRGVASRAMFARIEKGR